MSAYFVAERYEKFVNFFAKRHELAKTKRVLTNATVLCSFSLVSTLHYKVYKGELNWQKGTKVVCVERERKKQRGRDRERGQKDGLG